MSFSIRFLICEKENALSLSGERKTVKDHVPEKIIGDKQLVLVSKALYYSLSYDEEESNDNVYWDVLASHLLELAERQNLPKVLADFDEYNRCSIRLVMHTVGPVNVEELQGEDVQDMVTLPMKVLIFSGNSEDSSKSEREKGCLTKLVRLCGGPENVTLELEGMGGGDPPCFPSFEAIQDFCWNEEHLHWEAGAQVTFTRWSLRTLINSDLPEVMTSLGRVNVILNEAAVCLWLQRIYGNPGKNWRFQQRMLEEGTFADLEIVSGEMGAEEENRIKCHRMQLAGASQVFADMLKDTNCWEEAKTRTVKLPESKDTVDAMLHFIYYGGTERIFDCSVEVALELLQAAHKYDIQSLVEVTTFVLHSKLKPEEWFSVDAALELFCFARNVEGHCCTDLGYLSCNVLQKKSKEELAASEEYRKLVQIAEKLGPVLVAVFEGGADSAKEYLPVTPVSVSTEETSLVYDFICDAVSEDKFTFEVALAALVLAEHCERSETTFLSNFEYVVEQKFSKISAEQFKVDYLVNLFLEVRKKEGDNWKLVKKEVVRKLKWYGQYQPSKIEESVPFAEMFQRDYASAMEFSKISMEIGIVPDTEVDQQIN